MRRTHSPILLALIFSVGLPLHAQIGKSDPQLFQQVPFDQWVSQGPREQIPIKVRTLDAGLSIYQRLVAHAEISVRGKDLTKRGNKGDLFAFLEMRDGSGHSYRDALKLELTELKPDKRSTDLVFEWDALALPGEYTVVLALHHTGTGEHSLAQRTLRIRPLKDDPLPEAWRGLPSLEFLSQVELPDRDTFFHPEVNGQLALPVANKKPLHVELLADVTASELFRGSSTRYERYLYALIPTLKVFSQIGLREGSMDLATVDLRRHKVAFEQNGIKQLDWPAMKKTLAITDPSVIDVGHLSKESPKPDFLREELARRIGDSESQAMRVFIVITSPLLLYSFHGLDKGALPEECNCRVFYVEYDSSRRLAPFDSIDQVEKMLKPVRTRSFKAHSPETMRHALAKILNEMSSY